MLTLTGLQMVTGTEIRQPGFLFGEGKTQRFSEPLAAVVLACAVAGLGVAFVGGRAAGLGSFFLALAGEALLVNIQFKVEEEAVREAGGMIVEVVWKGGFWLALVGFVVAALLAAQRVRASLSGPRA